MKFDEAIQGDLFALPTFEPLAPLLISGEKPPIFVIGCGRHKRKSPTPAKDLYTSDRFKRSKSIAKNIGSSFFVLSAKHGLLQPNQLVEPYDVDIGTLDPDTKKQWATEVLQALSELNNGAKVILLAESNYAHPLLLLASELQCNIEIICPFINLNLEHIPIWLEQAERVSARIKDLKKLYAYIDTARESGLTFSFAELSGNKLPKRGVYVFLDPREQNFLNAGPRIVRVGTHAVSSESKSTLRTRLRSHFGQIDGGGNHRGSIFRLHVGRALLESQKLGHKYSTWGDGQHASGEIREKEIELEKEVSGYLSNLEVFIIPIDDEPSKDSLRAHVETQLIALCTEDFEKIDETAMDWLGKSSPMLPIVKSGLWNLRDVSKKYNPNDLGSVDHIISMQEQDL
ncbi:DUF6884 domain-containing protein [Pseudomonas sp. SWI36]|uniref:DUF6884 domain-containing protein n=1 Tax=Pseudomonas sp. SWI36 TaxID=2083052 RepID=UPI00131A37BE|nr:DUF6884 domain-containing protein [Pseudomonas sp. SWI36]